MERNDNVFVIVEVDTNILEEITNFSLG